MEPIYESASVYESVRAPLVTFPGFQAPILVSGSHFGDRPAKQPDDSYKPLQKGYLLINHLTRLNMCFAIFFAKKFPGFQAPIWWPADQTTRWVTQVLPKRLPLFLINRLTCLFLLFSLQNNFHTFLDVLICPSCHKVKLLPNISPFAPPVRETLLH